MQHEDVDSETYSWLKLMSGKQRDCKSSSMFFHVSLDARCVASLRVYFLAISVRQPLKFRLHETSLE